MILQEPRYLKALEIVAEAEAAKVIAEAEEVVKDAEARARAEAEAEAEAEARAEAEAASGEAEVEDELKVSRESVDETPVEDVNTDDDVGYGFGKVIDEDN